MPNIKSVKKDVVRSQKNRERNRSIKSEINTFRKKANVAVATDARADFTAALVAIYTSKADKAAKRGVIHPNKAARLKSRMMRRHASAQLAGSSQEGVVPSVVKGQTLSSSFDRLLTSIDKDIDAFRTEKAAIVNGLVQLTDLWAEAKHSGSYPSYKGRIQDLVRDITQLSERLVLLMDRASAN